MKLFGHDMEIEFLGTGTSTGVPQIGCECRVCRSRDEHDKRFRASAIVRTKGKSILIDAVNTALGGRIRGSVIRAGCDSAYVELMFSVPEPEKGMVGSAKLSLSSPRGSSVRL